MPDAVLGEERLLVGDFMMNLVDYFQAGRAGTSPEVLKELAQSPYTKIRMRVAENQSTPVQILEILGRDKDADVRIGLGYNRNTPVVILWKLAVDEHLDVRFSLADNANTIPLILMWLSEDDNPYIAQRADKTLNALSVSIKRTLSKGDLNAAAKTIEGTLRRKERLSKSDVLLLRRGILEDGYLSRGERRVVQYAIENDLLEDTAFESFLKLILAKHLLGVTNRAIA